MTGMRLVPLLALLVVPRLATADCARSELGPELITRAGAKLPADGGILVGWSASTDYKKPANSDPSQHAYKASGPGGKTVSLVMASLAPGLTVYRPKPVLAGALSVKDGKAVLVEVTVEKRKTAALPAPDVTAVTLTSAAARYGETYSIVTAAVASVPDSAVALIIYGQGDDEHVPLSFGRPAHDKQGATTVVVFTGAHNCSTVPGAMRAPAAGDQVELAWVDAVGRLSALSAPLSAK
jgi:hypothetical protein